MKKNVFWLKPWLHVIFLGIALFLGYKCGEKFTTLELVSYFSSLKNQGLALYTIFGIWLALIYPDALKKFFNSTSKEEGSSNNPDVIIFPLIVGTLCLAFGLVIDLFLPGLQSIARSYPGAKPWLLKIAYSLIVLGYIEQVVAFILSMVPIFQFKFDLIHFDTMASREKTKFKNSKTEDSPGESKS